MSQHSRAILALEDGTVFHGVSVGIEGIATGEVAFNTAMTGYQEILTDPSYSRQCIDIDSEPMILACDHHATIIQVLNGVISTMVTKFHFDRLGAASERENLMTETNAK